MIIDIIINLLFITLIYVYIRNIFSLKDSESIESVDCDTIPDTDDLESLNKDIELFIDSSKYYKIYDIKNHNTYTTFIHYVEIEENEKYYKFYDIKNHKGS